MACESRIEELELWSFLSGEWQSSRKDWVEEVWRSGRSSSRKGALPNWESLEAWFIEYLNSEMDAGKKWWSEFGQLRGLLRTRPWFHGIAPDEDKDQEDYLCGDD
jgi:hypothetical protein